MTRALAVFVVITFAWAVSLFSSVVHMPYSLVCVFSANALANSFLFAFVVASITLDFVSTYRLVYSFLGLSTKAQLLEFVGPIV